MAARKVSVGAEPPGGVAAAKRVEQVVEVPATVLVLTQAERMSARVLTSAVGRTRPGMALLAWPLAVLTRLRAGPRALVMPRRLVEEVPILVVLPLRAAKGASA